MLGATEFPYHYSENPIENTFKVSFKNYELFEKGVAIVVSSYHSGLVLEISTQRSTSKSFKMISLGGGVMVILDRI